MVDNSIKTKQTIVVRKDLNMRKGKIASQVAHASMKVLADRLEGIEGMPDDQLQSLVMTPELYDWLNNSFTKIVVGVDSEEELLQIYKKAYNSGLLCSLIQDNGTTEFGGVKTYTAVAVGPGLLVEVDGITSHLKLL